MSVEWQGDHRLLTDEKVAFERSSITDLAHPEHETCKLHGGHSKDWIGQYGRS